MVIVKAELIKRCTQTLFRERHNKQYTKWIFTFSFRNSLHLNYIRVTKGKINKPSVQMSDHHQCLIQSVGIGYIEKLLNQRKKKQHSCNIIVLCTNICATSKKVFYKKKSIFTSSKAISNKAKANGSTTKKKVYSQQK